MADDPEHPDDAAVPARRRPDLRPRRLPRGRGLGLPNGRWWPPVPGASAPRPRPARAAAAEVDAVLAKRHRVVAVRLTELEHLGWRRAAASDKRGQVGAWVRSVVAAELTRRQGADVPPDDGDAEAGAGVRVVLNDTVVRELAQQLVRVGSNMNQVTRFGAHRGPRPRHGCGGDGADGGGDRSDAGHDRRAGFSA